MSEPLANPNLNLPLSRAGVLAFLAFLAQPISPSAIWGVSQKSSELARSLASSIALVSAVELPSTLKLQPASSFLFFTSLSSTFTLDGHSFNHSSRLVLKEVRTVQGEERRLTLPQSVLIGLVVRSGGSGRAELESSLICDTVPLPLCAALNAPSSSSFLPRTRTTLNLCQDLYFSTWEQRRFAGFTLFPGAACAQTRIPAPSYLPLNQTRPRPRVVIAQDTGTAAS